MQDSDEEEERQNKSFERSASLRLSKPKDDTEEGNSQQKYFRRNSLGNRAKSLENLRSIGRKFDILPLFKRSNKQTSIKKNPSKKDVTRPVNLEVPSSLPIDAQERQGGVNGQQP